MDLISLVVTLVIIGVILWAINTFVPMEARIKQILNVVVVILVLLWLLSIFTGYHIGSMNFRVGK